MKTGYREVVKVLKAGGTLVRWERAKTAHLLDANGRTVRRVRVFTLWDMTDAGVIVGRWMHEGGDCEDMVYELPTTNGGTDGSDDNAEGDIRHVGATDQGGG